jgi:molybdate transport system substrate-binding protein
MRRIAILIVAAAAAGGAVAGCSSGTSSTAPKAASSPSGSITVFAASSLQSAFTTIGQQFEAAHPGTVVKFSFGASSSLAQEITAGSPADVFASAAPQNMDQVVSAGDASNPVTFAQNVMEVAVPPSNPAHVNSVSDLADSSVKTALCQPQVPCGFTAQKVFSNAKISVRPVTLQPDVKSVLTQVELNDVDAGVVYVTDVKAAGSMVKGIAIPSNENASTSYPIATVSSSKNKDTAQAFVSYVTSSAGQKVLGADGFEKP